MSSTPSRIELFARLAAADTVGQLAVALLVLATTYDDCVACSVFWGWRESGWSNSQSSSDSYEDSLPHERLSMAVALGSDSLVIEDGVHGAIRLHGADPAAVLVVTASPQAPGGALGLLRELEGAIAVAKRSLEKEGKVLSLQASLNGLERSERLQRALFAISDLSGSDLDMTDMLRQIQAIVGTLMYAENFFIVLHNRARDTLRFLYYADVEDPVARDPALEIPMSSRANSLTWYLLRDGKALMGNTDQLRPQVSGDLVVIGANSYDWLGVPMLRDGEVFGAIVVQSYQDGVGFSPNDKSLLEFVANHILIALERKRGKDELEQRVKQRTIELADANQGLQLEVIEREKAEQLQAALFQISQLSTADITQVEFYRLVHAIIGQLINATNFYIALLSEDEKSLDFAYFVDETEKEHPSRPLGLGFSEHVLKHGKLLMRSADIIALEKSGQIAIETAGPAASSWLGVPLLVDDAAIGLIVVQSYDDAVIYGPSDDELLGFVATQVANGLQRRRSAAALQRANSELEQRVLDRTSDLSREIVERERIQDQLTHQVMHDALTGLPNRAYMRDRLDRALTILRRDETKKCALLFLDVDRFKVINDSLGHLAGDEVLKEVARRLRTCARDPDVVARLSGDEFAILLEDVELPSTAIQVAERVLEAFSVPLLVGSTEISPSVSIGIAVGDYHYMLADEVLRDADTAMYRAKKLGRKRFELFDETMQKAYVDVLSTEGALRVALQTDQFEPYFQPIVSLKTDQIVGYEALIRWNHPTRGVLGPGDFLQIAEDSGLLEEIDWRMFELSCQAAVAMGSGSGFLTINVSPLHFLRPDFSARLSTLLEKTGMSPERLVVEITEGSLLHNSEQVRSTLSRLDACGIGAALDDFGTGYSSLSYLHTFPLRTLKIDRGFVSGLGMGVKEDSGPIVAAVLALAQALRLQVIAEGIETEEQKAILIEMGCEFGQGYLLGRPNKVSHWE